MSGLANGFGELEALALAELLEIHEQIESLIHEKSENGLFEARGEFRPLGSAAVPAAILSKGRTAAQRYRDPQSGATWSGRGKQPRWMAHLIKQGAKREDFRIGREH